ncbi:GHKL domain-containing protein [Prolixibacteraceae bacterium JC049]|nr:GHKL domain-containing protein [Prolixibacteraceae bacterium JC049]
MKNHFNRYLPIIIGTLLVMIFVSQSWGQAGPVKKVLVLHSYHQGLKWTDDVSDGIKETIQGQDEEIDLYFEYLDSKRYPDSLHFDNVQTYLRQRNFQSHFDLIITVDDDALRFLNQNRDVLYKNIPVVFCGVNNGFHQQLNDSLITGVRERPDFNATLDLMQQLHPEVETIHVINDVNTTTAILNRVVLDSIRKSVPIQLQFIDDVSIDELVDDVKQIASNDLILLLTFNKDKNNEFISYKEEIRLVAKHARVPIYSNWEFFLGRGIVGGHLLSGKTHGKRAAQTALQILKGKDPKAIPIANSTEGTFQFDYRQLKRYQIEEEQLPEGSVIINQPRDFLVLGRSQIIIISGIFLLGLVIILVLSRSIKKRITAEKELLVKQRYLALAFEQQRLMAEIVTYLNSTNDFTLVIDKVLNAIINTSDIEKIGIYSLSKDHLIGSIIGSQTSEQGSKIIELDLKNVFKIQNLLNQILDNQSIISHDLSGFTEEEKTFYQIRGIQSVLLIPIQVTDKIIGVAGFAYSTPHHWTDEEMQLLSTLIRVIANAWERNFQMNQFLEMEKQHAEAVQVMEQTSRLASIGVITGGITHEINQPLNAIRITTDTMLRKVKKTDNELTSYIVRKLNTIAEGTSRIDTIVKNMRNYWVNPVPNSEETETIELNSVLTEALQLLKRQIRNQGIMLKVNQAIGNLNIQGNKVQLEQVVINLVVNAIHALGEVERDEKQIVVKTLKREHSIELSVEDNGKGIEKDVGEMLFNPLYSTKKESGGSGLGLAIVRTFVSKMNGDISFENIDSGGVRFIIVFKTPEK